MEGINNQPKKHHYIPQFFLKNFSSDGKKMWVFDRYKKEYRFQSIREIAHENKFYSFTSKDGEDNLEILLSQVESLAKPILQKLLAEKMISGQERADFSMFLSLMYGRVPDNKKRTEESFEKLIKKINKMSFSNKSWVMQTAKKTNQNLSEKEIDELIEFAQDEKRYTIKFPSNYWIKSMLEISLEIAKLFYSMNWSIGKMCAPEVLITSDNPLILLPPKDYNPNSFYGVGLATIGAKKIISLSSNLYLAMHDLEHSPKLVFDNLTPHEHQNSINLLTAINSDRSIFSQSKDELEKIVSTTKIDKFIKKERVKVS